MALNIDPSPLEANRIWLEERKKIKEDIQSGKLKKEEILKLLDRVDEMRCNPPPPLPPEPTLEKEEKIIELEPSKKTDKKEIEPTVPSAKKEVVPQIHKKITFLLKEYEISKWDEVEVFFGLIEKWVGNMIRAKTVCAPLDLLIIDSYYDIVKKVWEKDLKKKEEK